MNRITKLLSAFTVFTVVLSSCNNPKKMADKVSLMTFKTNTEVLEVVGDSVQVSISAKFPPKSFAKNAYIKFQPVLKGADEDKDILLEPKYFVGEKVKTLEGQRIPFKEGGTIRYNTKVPYTEDMKTANLALDYTVKFVSEYEELDQCVTQSRDSVVRGTLTTALTLQPLDEVFSYVWKDKMDSTRGPGELDGPVGAFRKMVFYYVVDEGFLRDSVLRGPSMAKLRNIAKDTAFKFTRVILNSYASPEGELSRNKQLVYDRANSAFTLVKKEMKRLGIKAIQDSNLVRKPDINFEDWVGFRERIQNSRISNKAAVLAIIDSDKPFAEREKDLRALPNWNEVLGQHMPWLRRTEVVFVGKVSSRSYAEMTDLANNDVTQLTKKELLVVAENTDDPDLKRKLYKQYIEKFPNDWAGYNNLAVMTLNEGREEMKNKPFAEPEKVKEAEKLFEDLYSRFPSNDTVINNLGVTKRFLRKYDEAKELYTKAKGNGMNMDYNMGVLYTKYGDYANATSNFDAVSKCDYNVALAYLLARNYDEALKRIECIDKKTAQDFYLRGVVYARKGDKDNTLTSLTRAIGLDPSLSDYAKTDLEFRMYKESAEFKNAIRPK